MIYPNSLKPAMVALLAMATAAFAAPVNRPGPQAVSTLTFLAQGSIAEIELGHLAQQKSTNPVVKKFAQRMIEDHGALLERTRKLAQEQGVTLPAMPAAQDRAAMRNLERLSGKAFDDAYITMMLKDHRKDIQTLSQEKPLLHNQAVYSLVESTQPILENHIRAAEHASGELGLSARAGMNRPVHPVGVMPNQNQPQR